MKVVKEGEKSKQGKLEGIDNYFLIFVAILAGVLFVLPSIIILIGNFLDKMIFGNCTISQFIDSISSYSYEPVIEFYKGRIYKFTH